MIYHERRTRRRVVTKTNEVVQISVTVNQCVMVNIHFRCDELNSSTVNLWLSSSLVNSNPLTRKYIYILSEDRSLMTRNAWIHNVIFLIICSEFTMYCGCNFNIPFWQWFTEDTTKFPLSIGCYDYPQYYLEDLVQSDFYKCNG